MPSNNLHKINVYWISSVCYSLCQSAWSISETTEPILLISALQVYSKHNLASIVTLQIGLLSCSQQIL